MLSRHELPPLLPTLEIKDVQTSVLTQALQERLTKHTGSITISEVLNEWLQLDPVKVTMDQQIRVGAILITLGCTRVKTTKGVIYLPPESATVLVSRRESHKLSEPLRTDDPFPLFDFGPWSAVLVAAVLASSGVAIVLGLLAIGSWIHSGMSILPLGQPW